MRQIIDNWQKLTFTFASLVCIIGRVRANNIFIYKMSIGSPNFILRQLCNRNMHMLALESRALWCWIGS